MRLTALAILTALAACGTPAYLPDGGRNQLGCSSALTVIPVHTQDVNGMAVGGATVTARNASTGAMQTGTTNGDGNTAAITGEIGRGQIEITAQSGALATQRAFIVQIACGSCDCSAIPGAATVVLQ
jgi:hypothetical protein